MERSLTGPRARVRPHVTFLVERQTCVMGGWERPRMCMVITCFRDTNKSMISGARPRMCMVITCFREIQISPHDHVVHRSGTINKRCVRKIGVVKDVCERRPDVVPLG